MANKVTNTDIVKMNELYLTLKSYAAVARQTGFSSSTVSKYIQTNYRSIEEKAKNKKTFNLSTPPFGADRQLHFQKLQGHWGLMCELTEEEKKGLEELYVEI